MWAGGRDEEQSFRAIEIMLSRDIVYDCYLYLHVLVQRSKDTPARS
jgi:hypothetical protein